MAPAHSYHLVWALLVFAWVANYLVRMALSALLPPIMAELELSYTRAGVLATAFFYAYAGMQFPAGILGDRFGRRRVLAIGLVAGALASGATALAGSFAALLLARLFTGASQGFLFSNDRAIIASVTPPDKLGLGQAVSFTGPGLGISLGLLLAGLLGEHLPWRWVFVLFSVPPVVAALLIVRFVPASRAPGTTSRRAGLRLVVGARRLWTLGVSGATAMWAQFVLVTWAPLLFMESGVGDLGRAGVASSVLGLAAVLGLVVGGWASDRALAVGIARRTVLAVAYVATTTAAAASAVAIDRGASPVVLATTLFAINVFGWSVWGPSFALLGDAFKGGDLGTAFGLMNAITVIGAIVGPAITGWSRDLTGSFATGLWLSAAVAVAGAVIVALTPPCATART
ncbi:MAG: MFS transporter [Candidatus Rokubacteria bacterium]|nr:MFS transporter [Candidatus Rokubacteria bacterium]